MTETQLSKDLYITKAAIGYHLNQLLKANLIYLHNVEPEEHGILQKFYRPIAHIILPQYNRIPDKLKRRLIQIQLDHLIGVFAVLQLQNQLTRISTDTLEKLADAMLKQLESTCTQYLKKNAIKPENLKVKVYADALAHLANLDEWHTILKFTH